MLGPSSTKQLRVSSALQFKCLEFKFFVKEQDISKSVHGMSERCLLRCLLVLHGTHTKKKSISCDPGAFTSDILTRLQSVDDKNDECGTHFRNHLIKFVLLGHAVKFVFAI